MCQKPTLAVSIRYTEPEAYLSLPYEDRTQVEHDFIGLVNRQVPLSVQEEWQSGKLPIETDPDAPPAR